MASNNIYRGHEVQLTSKTHNNGETKTEKKANERCLLHFVEFFFYVPDASHKTKPRTDERGNPHHGNCSLRPLCMIADGFIVLNRVYENVLKQDQHAILTHFNLFFFFCIFWLLVLQYLVSLLSLLLCVCVWWGRMGLEEGDRKFINS